MIITKFNSYFDKHGKITYLLLCIIISVIFVFTIGASDGCRSENGLTSFGEMYGEDLNVTVIMRKEQQYRLSARLNNQGVPRGDYEMLLATLQKMRIVKKAAELKLDTITDAELLDAVKAMPYWQISERKMTNNELDSDEPGFTPVRFQRLIDNVVTRQFGLSGADFDEMVKEDIMVARVIENVTKNVKANDALVKTIAADSSVKLLAFPAVDSAIVATDAEIDAFLKTRAAEVEKAELPAYLVAFRTYTDIENAAKKDAALAASLKPTDAEKKAFFEQHKDTLFKDKKFEDVQAAVAQSCANQKREKWLDTRIRALKNTIETQIKTAGSIDRQKFVSSASVAKFNTAIQMGLPENAAVTGFNDIPQAPLATAFQAMDKANTVSDIIPVVGLNGEDGFALFVKLNTQDKNQAKRVAAGKIIIGERALKYYNENIVAVYGAQVTAAATMNDFLKAAFPVPAEANPFDPASMAASYKLDNTLLNTVAPFLENGENGKPVLKTPAATDATLIAWYKHQMALANAKQQAEAALAVTKKAIEAKDTNATQAFAHCTKKINWYMPLQMMMMFQQYGQDITPAARTQYQPVPATNYAELIAALDKAGDNTLLDQPFEFAASRDYKAGYVLVFQEKRTYATEGDAGRNSTYAKSMMEGFEKRKALESFLTVITVESNTKLNPLVIPEKETTAAETK